MKKGDGFVLFSGFTDSYLLEVFASITTENKLLLLSPANNIETNEKYVINFDLYYDFDIKYILTGRYQRFSAEIDEKSYFEIYPAFLECRYYFDRTLDRILVDPISTKEKEAYFRILLTQCINFLAQNDIRAIFFHATPHFPPELCLYFAAKHLSIDTFITRRTLIDNTIYIASDFRRNSEKYLPLNVGSESSLSMNECRNSAWLSYSKSIISRVSEYNRMRSLYKLVRISLAAILGRKVTIWYYHLGRLKTIRLLIKRYFEINANQSSYRNLSTANINLDRPYIVFFLHFQPERSTLPEAEYFDNQFDLINLISAVLPENYMLYVKEHPRQDMDVTDFRQLGIRTPADYKQLAMLKNVTLVDKTFSSTKLMSQASLIISCNGSSLWEGLLSSIPGLSFAKTWHSLCASTPCFNERISLKETIESLLAQSPDEVESNLRSFISEFDRYSVRSVNLGVFASKDSNQRREQIKNYTNALTSAIQSFHGLTD